jgi:foldase protein PrsA
VDITLTQLERAVARTRPDSAADPDALRATVLDTLIEQELIRQAAAEMNITVSDAEVQAEIDANRALEGSDAEWQIWLDQNLFTEEEFRTEILATLLTVRLRDAVTADMPAEVPQVNARHILVATQAEADDLLNQLNGGADFATLAAEHSRDMSTRDQGGDLGWFSSGDLLEPTLEEAALTMQPGELQVVTTRLGYHVLQTLEVTMRPVDPALLPQLQQQRFLRWLQSLLENATIERYFW